MSKNHRKSSPEQYHGKNSMVPKVVEQTDLRLIWEGWKGILLAEGMHFSVADVDVYSSGKPVRAVRVLDAPSGTELFGLGGSATYVTVAQLHMNEFASRLHEETEKEAQNRIWACLNRILVESMLKTVNRLVPQENRPQGKKYLRKISPSFKEFALCIPSEYCFDKGSPYAVFKVRLELQKPKTGWVMRQVPAIILVSVQVGHSLYGLVPVGTKVPHKMLSWTGNPKFKSIHASAQFQMWKFLRSLYAAHRDKEFKDIQNAEGVRCQPKLTLVPTA